jgi:hypothetical protein
VRERRGGEREDQAIGIQKLLRSLSAHSFSEFRVLDLIEESVVGRGDERGIEGADHETQSFSTEASLLRGNHVSRQHLHEVCGLVHLSAPLQHLTGVLRDEEFSPREQLCLQKSDPRRRHRGHRTHRGVTRRGGLLESGLGERGVREAAEGGARWR